MRKLFLDLFDYNHAMNLRFIEAIAGISVPKDDLLRFMSHILNAHQIWLERMEGLTVTLKPWDTQLETNYVAIEHKNFSNTTEILINTNEEEFDKILEYKTSTGVPFQNSNRDILMHIINHSTHHRAQIALLIRKREIDPPISDYIFHRRQT